MRRYWWHDAVVKELRRLQDECDMPGYNVKGIASNLRFSHMDTRKYVAELLGDGTLEEIEPLWDCPGATWVALTEN